MLRPLPKMSQEPKGGKIIIDRWPMLTWESRLSHSIGATTTFQTTIMIRFDSISIWKNGRKNFPRLLLIFEQLCLWVSCFQLEDQKEIKRGRDPSKSAKTPF